MQKRAVRIIAGKKYNDHTTPIFNELHILKLDDLYKAEVAKTVFQFHKNTLPPNETVQSEQWGAFERNETK